MPREPEGYRDQLERLYAKFPDREMITIIEASKVCGCDRRTLLADSTFPAKQIGGAKKYFIPLVGLARWMTLN
jgi:hypothetical protein